MYVHTHNTHFERKASNIRVKQMNGNVTWFDSATARYRISIACRGFFTSRSISLLLLVLPRELADIQILRAHTSHYTRENVIRPVAGRETYISFHGIRMVTFLNRKFAARHEFSFLPQRFRTRFVLGERSLLARGRKRK